MSSMLHFWVRRASKSAVLWVQTHQQGSKYKWDFWVLLIVPPPLYCWKQICHSKTATKLTSCSLSDSLIEGRYHVLRPIALGYAVSLQQPCIILTPVCCDMSMTGRESMNAAALQPFSIPHKPIPPCRQPWGWERGLHRSSPLSWAAVWVQEVWWCCGQLRLRGRRFGLQWGNKLLSNTFPPPGCLYQILLIFSGFFQRLV